MTKRPAGSRPLTEHQRAVLKALQDHGAWWRAGSWRYDTDSNTARILDALVRRGHASVTVNKTVRTALEPQGRKEYRTTETGRALKGVSRTPGTAS